MRTTFSKNVSLRNKILRTKDQAKQLQQQVKDLTFDSMKPRVELPYMYSNLNFNTINEKESSDEEGDDEDLQGFVKFLLVGNLQKKQTVPENDPPSSEEDVVMQRMSQEQTTPRRANLPILSRFDQSQQSPQEPPADFERTSSLLQTPIIQQLAPMTQLSELPASAFESPFVAQRPRSAQTPSECISQYTIPPNYNQISEVIVLGDFIIARLERGVCFAFNRFNKQTLLINKNKRETIKSTFLNQVNNSIFIVSVKQNSNMPYLSSMQCRSVSFENLESGNTRGRRLFKNFTLQYPDFVEVDDLNRKVVTKHSVDQCFRVWDLGSYEMLYVLRNKYLYEFKICNGVMLLMFEQINNNMPMTILNVHTGKPIKDFYYKKQDDLEYEFLEQYNEKILIKYRDRPLEIYDVLTNKINTINNFETPEAFIFVYEKELFLSLRNGRVRLYSINGEIVSDFQEKCMYSQEIEALQAQPGLNPEEFVKKTYQLSLSDSRNRILTVVKEKHLQPEDLKQIRDLEGESSESEREEGEMPKKRLKTGDNTFKKIQMKKGENVYINVIDIKKGQNIAKISPYKLDILSSQKVCKKNQPETFRSLIQEQTSIIQDDPLEKKRKLQQDGGLLFSLPKLIMTPQRYTRLMEEISVVYYDEQRHEIITGHQNGSIMLWK